MPTHIIIVAHTPLASALQAGLRHVDPLSADKVDALDVQPDESVEEAYRRLQALIASKESNSREAENKALLLTDLPFATPHNAAVQYVELHASHSDWISGVSLPMLVKAWNYRDISYEELREQVVATGARCAISSF